jgi:hypothetical protein
LNFAVAATSQMVRIGVVTGMPLWTVRSIVSER